MITEIPPIDPGQQDQAREMLTTAGGVIIAAALVIFGWRMLNGTAKTVLIVVGLVLFVIAFVVPNMGG